MSMESQSEEELVLSFEFAVRRVAKNYAMSFSGFSWEDHLQVLRLEVLRAVREWTPSGGASMSTYVYRRLVHKCQNTNRHQRLRGFKVPNMEQPIVLSLNAAALSNPDDPSDDTVLDTIPGDANVAAEAEARCQAAFTWALVEELLGDKPRVLRALELFVGRRGAPLHQRQIAAQFGVSQMAVSRWLRQARTLLFQDPRLRELVEE